MELRQTYLIIHRRLWLIVLCTALSAISAAVVCLTMSPVYQASTTLLVQQAPSGGSSDYQDILTSERLARTYSEMLEGRPVLEQAINELDLTVTADELAERVDVELVRDTQLIKLKVEDADPARAALFANAIAQAFITRNQALQEQRYADSLTAMRQEMDELLTLIKEAQRELGRLEDSDTEQDQDEVTRLESTLAGYRNTYASLLQSYEQMRVTAVQSSDDVIVFEEARAVSKPVRPRTLMNTGLAGVLGAIIGLGTAFLIDYLDDSVKTPDDIGQATGLGTLGTIGAFSSDDPELVTASEPLSPISEAFRTLRTNIRFTNVDEPIRTLLVTSPGATEGKSVVAANLAVTMAQGGLRVMVVDSDLRHPQQHRLFELPPEGGLTISLLEGSTDGRLKDCGIEGLEILPAGEQPPNPADLLGSQQMRRVLESLRQEADIVIIDSPPVLPVTDAAVLAQAVDGVLLVVDAGETRREALQQAVEALKKVQANVMGTVLNRVPWGRSGYYRYQDYHRYDNPDRKGRKRASRCTILLAALRRVLSRKSEYPEQGHPGTP
jgi:non-specific protein-tyrosine kinase